MNDFIRAFMAFAAVLPISIPIGFVFSGKILAYVGLNGLCGTITGYAVVIAIAVLLNWLLGLGCVKSIRAIARMSDKRAIRIVSIKPLGSDSLMTYLPYVLPLFLTQSGDASAPGWVLGFLLLFALAWFSMTIPFSPLLKVCGLSFYEAVLEDERVITLLVLKHQEPLRVRAAFRITDFCMLGEI